MKALADQDTSQIHKIEAARFSWAILQRSWNRLLDLQRAVESTGSLTDDVAIEIVSLAWSVVDFGTRFCNVVSQIRGLRRKDDRFAAMERAKHRLIKIRNYIQHLDQETHANKEKVAPILGALSWSSVDGQRATTIALGTLPPKCNLHSVGFDRIDKRYVADVVLDVGSVTLELKGTVAELRAMFDYLEAWLNAENLVKSDKELSPNVFGSGPIEVELDDARRFLRLRFQVNDRADEAQQATPDHA